MPTPPDSTKTSLHQRLHTHARTHWPHLADLHIRHHGTFAYIHAELPNGDIVPLMRLRYTGSATHWGFALYLASTGKYDNAILPTGSHTGTPEQALDCAAGLYLTNADP